MKDDIRCATCPMMKMSGRARYTGNNSHMAKPRGDCFCNHPDAHSAFELICPSSHRMACFIGYTKGSSDKPDIKTAPRWCPRKMAAKPMEISEIQGCQVIDNRRPRGLFFVVGSKVTGIDNRYGDAWTEDFDTKRECLKWLLDERGEEDEGV